MPSPKVNKSKRAQQEVTVGASGGEREFTVQVREVGRGVRVDA